MDDSGVNGLHGGELLLQPDDISFKVVVVIIREKEIGSKSFRLTGRGR
jgi:hypothetical protein